MNSFTGPRDVDDWTPDYSIALSTAEANGSGWYPTCQAITGAGGTAHLTPMSCGKVTRAVRIIDQGEGRNAREVSVCPEHTTGDLV